MPHLFLHKKSQPHRAFPPVLLPPYNAGDTCRSAVLGKQKKIVAREAHGYSVALKSMGALSLCQ